MKYKEAVWSIGTYGDGAGSLCVNLDFDGRRFHRHDFGGVLPRFIRLGKFITELERESGCRESDKEYLEAFHAARASARSGESIGDAMFRMEDNSRLPATPHRIE